MRPLVVDLGREYRGGEHQALLLVKGLLARGHTPELIAVQDSLLAGRAKEAGITVHCVAMGRKRFGATLQIRKLVRSRRVDVIHANEPHALSAAWLARAHRSVPIVASRRIALPLSRGSVSLARYRSAARIVAVSRFVERSVVESGLSPDHVEVIYDGVEIPPEITNADRENAREEFGIPPGGLCIGNVAALVPEKGQEILLRAFAKLRGQFPDCILLLCGDGPERARLARLAVEITGSTGTKHSRRHSEESRHWRDEEESLGSLDSNRREILRPPNRPQNDAKERVSQSVVSVADAVKFVSPVGDIGEILAAMDVFAFPSHEEPLGSALLAAMSHGLPVVAIGRGGIPEVVEDGKNGLLVNSLDPDALASAIAGLLANPEEARHIGGAARETIVARFSADRMVEATLRLYEEVTSGE